MRTRMKLSTPLAAVALVALLVPTIGRKAQAQERGRHPAYIHALSDLRAARAYLDRLTPNEHMDEAQQHAVQEIDEAMAVIKRAAIDDGKGLNDHVPVDVHIPPANRFHKAQDSLRAAMHDVNEAEDDPQTRDVKKRAIDHIHTASVDVEKIMEHLHIS